MIQLSAPAGKISASVAVSGSKSLSNRLLLLNEIAGAGIRLDNLSQAEDTQLLQQALEQVRNNSGGTININHAGTDMRFLTAYLSVSHGSWVLTGSERIKERPVGGLVKALRALGADITCMEKEGFPPLKISGKRLTGGSIDIDAGVSSQFVSALLLIAPLFEKGLQLTLKGNVVSRPYISMSIALLKDFGVKISEQDNKIEVHASPPSSLFPLPSSIPPLSSSLSSSIFHLPSSISIESDWSSASYWYSICSLSKDAEITLHQFNTHSLQADAVLPELYDSLGVKTTYKDNTIVLSSKPRSARSFAYDFTSCPDIAQTLAATCFGLGIKADLTGLQTLKLKETDRLAALKSELEKLGACVSITNNSLHLEACGVPGSEEAFPFPFSIDQLSDIPLPSVKTYHDHRMAMSFAPLALLYPALTIEDPGVVDKSYPAFWQDLESVGFNVNLHP